MVCQDSHFLIENISFYEDAKLSQELTAEADWKRRGLYIGPTVLFSLLFTFSFC
jgi:complement component 1 Q subcomponent-binding protein